MRFNLKNVFKFEFTKLFHLVKIKRVSIFNYVLNAEGTVFRINLPQRLMKSFSKKGLSHRRYYLVLTFQFGLFKHLLSPLDDVWCYPDWGLKNKKHLGTTRKSRGNSSSFDRKLNQRFFEGHVQIMLKNMCIPNFS